MTDYTKYYKKGNDKGILDRVSWRRYYDAKSQSTYIPYGKMYKSNTPNK